MYSTNLPAKKVASMLMTRARCSVNKCSVKNDCWLVTGLILIWKSWKWLFQNWRTFLVCEMLLKQLLPLKSVKNYSFLNAVTCLLKRWQGWYWHQLRLVKLSNFPCMRNTFETTQTTQKCFCWKWLISKRSNLPVEAVAILLRTAALRAVKRGWLISNLLNVNLKVLKNYYFKTE